MFRNNLKIAWRNLLKNRTYSFINIAGLAAGMVVAMIIGLWISDELSVNRQFKNYESIYQVMLNQTFDGKRTTQTAVPCPLGEELKTKYPDIKAVALSDWGRDHALVYGDKKISKRGYFIGEDAVNIFSLDIQSGDKNPLHDPLSIVLTEEMAKALFPNENPVNKIVRMDNRVDLKVTAVVSKISKSSSLSFDYLIPFSLQKTLDPNFKNEQTDWSDNSWQVFIQLNDQSTAKNLESKIKNVVASHLSDENTLKNIKPEVFIYPMSKWRLYSDFENGVSTGGFIKYVKMFGILGLVVLIIACINFMNLSTARSEKRAKEVGVRKAVGSNRKQLIRQFLMESLFFSLLAFGLALAITTLVLPYFNRLTEKEMSLQFTSPLLWIVMIVFTFLTGLLAGSYPAFYLSSFNPVNTLKGNLKTGRSDALPRKILVVLQFTSSVILMIGTVIVYQEIQHAKNRPTGFDNRGLITIDRSESISKNFEALRQDLLNSGVVNSICKSNAPPTEIYSTNSGWQWKNSQTVDKSVLFSTIATEYDYTKTMGIRMAAGRDFSRDYADSNSLMLNEAAVKRMGLKNPIGEIVSWNGFKRTVVGVVPDMQMESPFHPVSPLTIIFNKYWTACVDVRLDPNVSASAALKKIQPIFEKYNPGFPFIYRFADTEYAKKFNYEELVGNLSAIIAVIAIFISCLGLFGLASFTAEQRVKEIGVRKVLGASVVSLWQLLSRDFVKLVLISCLMAVPIAYYLMNLWLNNYEYKINIGFGVFAMVIGLSIIITLVTVSFQAIRAARANPTNSLRSE
jgi:putative ABC transport system permease protein